MDGRAVDICRLCGQADYLTEDRRRLCPACHQAVCLLAGRVRLAGPRQWRALMYAGDMLRQAVVWE